MSNKFSISEMSNLIDSDGLDGVEGDINSEIHPLRDHLSAQTRTNNSLDLQ